MHYETVSDVVNVINHDEINLLLLPLSAFVSKNSSNARDISPSGITNGALECREVLPQQSSTCGTRLAMICLLRDEKWASST